MLASLARSLAPAYVIDRELGGGGMSRVFLATDVRLERQVVVKVLSPELAAGISAERFTREIKLAAQLQEPHIVPVFADGTTTDGLPYYLMPYVRGASLRQRMDEGPLPPADAVRILRDVAQALAYAHGQGVVHRDIKPENVLLHEGTAVVTDFGIAKALSASRTQAPGGTLTQIGTSLGTPAYMSPEQAAGDDTDHRADLYAWGVMAYELLANRHPYSDKATAQQLIAAQISVVPPPLDARKLGVSPRVAAVVMRCLAKNPANRPASAADVLRELDVSAQRERWSRTWLIGTAAALVVLAIAGFVAKRRERGHGAADGDVNRSVAILPLANVGGDTADVYFADGLTDELTNAVAKIAGLRVVGGASAAIIKSRGAIDLADVASRLHVGSVLEGTVRRAGTQLRITARLSNTRDGRIIWTESYDRAAGDVFGVQQDISRAVAAALRVTLGMEDATRLAHGGTRDTLAHDLYLRAHFLHSQYGEANLRQAIVLYERAAARDPRFAEAWAGAGLAWFNLADEYIPPREAASHIRDAARRALAIDSTLGDARVLAMTTNMGRTDSATLMRAAESAPNSSLAQLMAAMQMVPVSPDAAALLAERATALDPLAGIMLFTQSFILGYTDRVAEEEQVARRAVALSPELGLAHAALGTAILRRGDAAGALAEFKQGIANGDKDLSAMGMGMALAKLGRMTEARAYLDGFEKASHTRYVIGDWAAKLALAVGDRAAALRWLERASDAGSAYTAFIDRDPQFAVLRGDPRFEAVRGKAVR